MIELLLGVLSTFFGTVDIETLLTVIATLSVVSWLLTYAIVYFFRVWFKWNGRLFPTVAFITTFLFSVSVYIAGRNLVNITYYNLLSVIVLWAILFLSVLGLDYLKITYIRHKESKK